MTAGLGRLWLRALLVLALGTSVPAVALALDGQPAAAQQQAVAPSAATQSAAAARHAPATTARSGHRVAASAPKRAGDGHPDSAPLAVLAVTALVGLGLLVRRSTRLLGSRRVTWAIRGPPHTVSD